MSTDREMLELAAKAAGIQYNTARERGSGWILSTIIEAPDLSHVEEPIWNPLGDDGDALRLAVKLKIEIAPEAFGKSRVDVRGPSGKWMWEQYSTHGDDAQKATRHAIVMAAAEIGRAMP